MWSLSTSIRFVSVIVALAAVLSACDSSSTNPDPLVIPTSYPSDGFQQNAQTELEVLTHLQNLTDLMQIGRSGSAVAHADLVTAMAPLRPVTVPSFQSLADVYALELAGASGGTYDPTKAPSQNGQGGVYGGYLFDEHGVELEQLIEKGLYASMCYNHAVQVMKNSSLTIPQLDAVVAIFGATPAFANSDDATTNKDRFAAKYAARRDKNDGTGSYTRFRDGALLAHGAITAGADYVTRQREGLTVMRRNWERSQMATVINYLYATIDKLSQTTVSDADRASAMHAFSEAVGFMLGFRGLEQGVTVITAEQVDALLTEMRTPPTGAWTPYLFWQNPSETLPELQAVMATIQEIYGFTSAEMESFRYNWVAVQGR
jgi:hypothetical protein